MNRLFLSAVVGYAVCVWDASCHPIHERWPSATALYLVLIARWAPGFCLWSGGLCGVIHDAAMGGRIGPGVIAATMAVSSCRWGDQARFSASKPVQFLTIAAAVLSWLLVPVAFRNFSPEGEREDIARLLSHQGAAAVSSILLVLAVIAIAPRHRQEE